MSLSWTTSAYQRSVQFSIGKPMKRESLKPITTITAIGIIK